MDNSKKKSTGPDWRILRALAKVTGNEGRYGLDMVRYVVTAKSTTYEATDGYCAVQVRLPVGGEPCDMLFPKADIRWFVRSQGRTVMQHRPQPEFPDFEPIMPDGKAGHGSTWLDPNLLAQVGSIIGDVAKTLGKPVPMARWGVGPTTLHPLSLKVAYDDEFEIIAIVMPMRGE